MSKASSMKSLHIDPQSAELIKRTMQTGAGRIVITSSLGVDVFDCWDTVEFFEASSELIGTVQTMPANDWDMMLPAFAIPNTAVVEVDDVATVNQTMIRMVDGEKLTVLQALNELLPWMSNDEWRV